MIFSRLIILFIFVLVLLILNIPQAQKNNLLIIKLYIFIGIFIFEFVTSLLISFTNKQLFNTNKVAKDSLLSSLVAVVAYSIYNDMTVFNNCIDSEYNTISNNIAISAIIVFFMIIKYFLEYIFINESPHINDHLNNIYFSQNK